MLAVVEVRHQVVEPHHGRAAENSVVTSDLQLREHVPHDPRDGAEVGDRHHAAVHGARLLLGEPLGDAGIAEGVLAVRSLPGEEQRRAPRYSELEKRGAEPRNLLPSRLLRSES